jgi:hypothetical protein
MQIDGAAISISDILHGLEIISIVGGGMIVAFRLGRTHAAIEAAITNQNIVAKLQSDEIAELKAEVKKLGDVLTALAVQENRLDMHEKWIDELRHGRGFVMTPAKHG